MLSPHAFLLGVLISHRAFRVESLNGNIENLSNLRIHPEENELPLPLKLELDEVFLFRSVERDFSGDWKTSDKRIMIGKMSAIVRSCGRIAGFSYPTINYSLR